MINIYARNVNEALSQFKALHDVDGIWRNVVGPHDKRIREAEDAVCTTYARPCERVLFDIARDANPFFHFFEALWILNGSNDVAFLEQFNSKMRDYSDDGVSFHAPYGHRLRKHFVEHDCIDGDFPVDQIAGVIHVLRKNPRSRQAVMTIWDPVSDLDAVSKDIPCNDVIFFKIHGKDYLDMTVCCRSNDVIWGAYGTNVVQFSMIQQVIANALGIYVGKYRQISDSFHVYMNEPSYIRTVGYRPRRYDDPYRDGVVIPYDPILNAGGEKIFFKDLQSYMEDAKAQDVLPHPKRSDFFNEVASPLYRAWQAWKDEKLLREERIFNALGLVRQCAATDWKLACHQWLSRREEIRSTGT